MAVSKAKKSEILAKLEGNFQKSKAAIFVNFQGMTVDDTVKLRKFLKTSDVDYQVAKKTLMRLMAQNAKVDSFDDSVLEGSIGIIFGYTDEVSLAKMVKGQTKQFDKLKIVAGIIENKMVDANTVNTLASLPSREELLAKLVGTMLSPLRGFVGSLQNPISGFVRVLQAYSEKKPA